MKIFSIFSQISISKLFKPEYIFAKLPSSDGLYLYLLIIFGLELLAAILLSVFKSRLNRLYFKLQNRFFNLFLTTAITGIVLTFFRYEQIAYLGSRLMFLILILTFLIWLLWIIYYWIFQIPKEKLELHRKQRFNKYLPAKAGRQP